MGDLPLRTPTHRRLGGPLPRRLANATHAHPSPELIPLNTKRCLSVLSRGIRRNFFRLSPCDGQVAYVLLTRAPVAGRSKQAYSPAAPRLACVKPVASVHPEPGSNSPLLVILFFSFFFKSKKGKTSLFYCLLPSQDHRRIGRSMTVRTLLIGSRIDRVHFCSLVLLLMSIVIVSMCSLLSGTPQAGLVPKSGCKVKTLFCFLQIFAEVLTTFNFRRRQTYFVFCSLVTPAAAVAHSRKRVQSYTIFLFQPNFFQCFYVIKHIFLTCFRSHLTNTFLIASDLAPDKNFDIFSSKSHPHHSQDLKRPQTVAIYHIV